MDEWRKQFRIQTLKKQHQRLTEQLNQQKLNPIARQELHVKLKVIEKKLKLQETLSHSFF